MIFSMCGLMLKVYLYFHQCMLHKMRGAVYHKYFYWFCKIHVLYISPACTISDEVVCLGCRVLRFHKLFKLKIIWRHQTNAKRIHVSFFKKVHEKPVFTQPGVEIYDRFVLQVINIGRGDVLSSKSSADASSLVNSWVLVLALPTNNIVCLYCFVCWIVVLNIFEYFRIHGCVCE